MSKTKDTPPASSFRRGAVLGTYSPTLTPEDLPRKKSHSRRRRARRFFMSIFILLVLAAAALLLRSQYISAFQIESKFNGREYTEAISDYFSARPLSRFYFFLDQPDLSSYIQNKFPECQELSLAYSEGFLSSAATFKLTPRTPIAKWQLSDTTYFVDKTGKPFTKNLVEDPTLIVTDENTLYIDDSTSAIASTRFLNFIGQTSALLTERKVTVEKIIIPLGQSREVDFIVQGSTSVFRLSIDRSPESSAKDLALILDHAKKKNLRPAYFDMRLAGKAYYK